MIWDPAQVAHGFWQQTFQKQEFNIKLAKKLQKIMYTGLFYNLLL